MSGLCKSIIVCGLVSAAVPLHTMGQSFYNRGAIVSVLPGTTLSVSDSLENTGTLINDGNLVIGGTWLNAGVYNPGGGEITFNSASPTTPQIINHNNQSFSKLTISGGGKKVILADITVEEEIVLLDGVIEAENSARVIIQPAAVITGGSDASHIHAPVYQTGSGEKLFPLGNGSEYLPVTLSAVDDPSAVIGIEGVELEDLALSLSKAPSLDAISVKRYWHVDVAAGSLNSTVAIPLRDEGFPGGVEKAVVAESADISGTFESLGQSVTDGTTTNGMVTSGRPVSQPFITAASSSDDGSIFVYNAISANGDGLNEFLRILNIENYPDNKFTLFNRWGDKVFELTNYDNRERVFRGRANIGGDGELVNGTYYYVIETGPSGPKVNGFLAVKK